MTSRMAGREFIYALLATGGVPVVAALIDGVTGPENFGNSGELGANALHSLYAPAAMAAAAGGAAALIPEARLTAKYLPLDAQRWILSQQKIGPEPGYMKKIQDRMEKLQSLNQKTQEIDQEIKDFIQKRRSGPLDGLGPDRARYSAGRRGVEQLQRTGREFLGASALLGGVLGALNAMGGMEDRR